MNLRFIPLFLFVGLTGCIATVPAPVADRGAPKRIEAPLATAAAPAAGSFYTVKKGDTLYSIALDHGIEYRELASWNNIDNPARIRVGQQLRVAAAEPAPAAVAVAVAVATPAARPRCARSRAADR